MMITLVHMFRSRPLQRLQVWLWIIFLLASLSRHGELAVYTKSRATIAYDGDQKPIISTHLDEFGHPADKCEVNEGLQRLSNHHTVTQHALLYQHGVIHHVIRVTHQGMGAMAGEIRRPLWFPSICIALRKLLI
jgi:hypothetical protein